MAVSREPNNCAAVIAITRAAAADIPIPIGTYYVGIRYKRRDKFQLFQQLRYALIGVDMRFLRPAKPYPTQMRRLINLLGAYYLDCTSTRTRPSKITYSRSSTLPRDLRAIEPNFCERTTVLGVYTR